MLLEVPDVFQDYVFGCVLAQDHQDDIEISASLIGLPILVSRLGEGLAWEAGAQKVVPGDGVERCADVTGESPLRKVEVPQVDRPELGIYLRRKDAVVAKAFKGDVKSTEAGEQIYESHDPNGNKSLRTLIQTPVRRKTYLTERRPSRFSPQRTRSWTRQAAPLTGSCSQTRIDLHPDVASRPSTRWSRRILPEIFACQ
jgi:hypothetical protein